MAHPKKLIPINAEYIRDNIKGKGLTYTDLSIQMGKEQSYISYCLRRAEMAPAEIKFLSLLTGMDEVQMKVIPKLNPVSASDLLKEDEKPSDAFKTYAAINENTELVISYMQDLGKIQTEILRELKETRNLIKEMTEKHNREFHELDIYLRNSGAEARKSREATNNNLINIHNYIQRKLEQQIK